MYYSPYLPCLAFSNSPKLFTIINTAQLRFPLVYLKVEQSKYEFLLLKHIKFGEVGDIFAWPLLMDVYSP